LDYFSFLFKDRRKEAKTEIKIKIKIKIKIVIMNGVRGQAVDKDMLESAQDLQSPFGRGRSRENTQRFLRAKGASDTAV
jgi:hypothetical protein